MVCEARMCEVCGDDLYLTDPLHPGQWHHLCSTCYAAEEDAVRNEERREAIEIELGSVDYPTAPVRDAWRAAWRLIRRQATDNRMAPMGGVCRRLASLVSMADVCLSWRTCPGDPLEVGSMHREMRGIRSLNRRVRRHLERGTLLMPVGPSYRMGVT
jgi:hypothetical protein